MRTLLLALPLVALAACNSKPAPAPFDFSQTQGPNPVLEAPQKNLLPTVNVANADGWPQGKMPTAAAGLKVEEFAGPLDHPRSLLVLPNGDVLVALTDAPGTDKTGGTVKGTIQNILMKKAGSHSGSPDRIMLLRDTNGDGIADQKIDLLGQYLYSPFGMAYRNGELIIANANSLIALPYKLGDTRITGKPRLITELPSGYNHHWTKSLTVSPDGRYYFVGVGSNSNIGENGMAMEVGRAAVWQIDAATGQYKIFASGIRNPTALEFNPVGGALWAVANERDELGNDLVPDYLTSVKQGAFYGWPWSYYGGHVDERVKPANPAMVAKAIAPDYALGSHVAPLGMVFGSLGPYRSGVFISEHGSWNRKPWSGYQVVFVPFKGANPDPAAKPIPVLTGFRVDNSAYGRPVGLAVAKDGSLLVADDVGNKVWRLSAAK
ncbi:sorbosone dehydrogenase family protein [Sphingomonas sp. ASV193]|uniref:PQQ-dependent sugar dehydrogenase n=1 Tax=Sphingomonas sp. ASV193 TaxID=3144405 RepID=UPI0032E8F315